VLRADSGDALATASREVRGAAAMANQALTFSRLGGPELLAQPALVNGAVGRVVFRGGQPFSVMGFTVRGGKIVEIDILADPEHLVRLDLSVLDD